VLAVHHLSTQPLCSLITFKKSHERSCEVLSQQIETTASLMNVGLSSHFCAGQQNKLKECSTESQEIKP
jgi:hypothetical protein